MPDHRQRPPTVHPTDHFAREFSAEHLDLDDLAGAIRSLLNNDQGAAPADLLSFEHGATDVMEANQTQ